MKTRLLSSLLLATAALAPVSQGAIIANLLANPDFEGPLGGGVAGWGTFGNVFTEPETAVVTGDYLSDGTTIAKFFGNFEGGFNVSGLVQGFPATEGETYELQVSSQINSIDPMPGSQATGGNWAVAKIAFFDAPTGGSEIPGAAVETFIGDGALSGFPQDVWVQSPVVVGTAPVGTQRVEALMLYLQPSFDGGAVFLDNASFGLQVPEPSSMFLLGLSGVALLRRRR